MGIVVRSISSECDLPFIQATNPSTFNRKYWPRIEVSSALSSYFSNDSSNPFHNWNILFMKYCDGSSYSSYVKDPVKVKGTKNQTYTVYYRGESTSSFFFMMIFFSFPCHSTSLTHNMHQQVNLFIKALWMNSWSTTVCNMVSGVLVVAE